MFPSLTRAHPAPTLVARADGDTPSSVGPTLLPLRRHLLASGVACCLWPAVASAQFRVDISGVGATQIPLAIGAFGGEAQSPQPIGSIIGADLERSGYFKIMPLTAPLLETSAPTLSDYRGQGVDALVGGSVNHLADGRFDVRFRLWDAVKGQDLGGQSFVVGKADLRLAAHRISDFIYEKLTGERGVAATRIAYVTKGGSSYALRITDADGEGGQVMVNSREPIISPAWSPNGKEIAYVSFETRKAVVWVQDVATGARRQLANFRGSNSAPAWSPDGSQLAVTLSQAGGSQIFLIGRQGGAPKRITKSSAIDTEAVFAPGGGEIYFVSDRGGSPQIYRQSTSAGNATRVTFSGSYNISPALSPDGKLLAFVQRQGGAMRVMLQDLASGQVRAISDTSADESPSFAPNGKLLIYATRAQGREVLMTSTLDGKIKTTLLTSGQDIREPAWGPYGR